MSIFLTKASCLPGSKPSSGGIFPNPFSELVEIFGGEGCFFDVSRKIIMPMRDPACVSSDPIMVCMDGGWRGGGGEVRDDRIFELTYWELPSTKHRDTERERVTHDGFIVVRLV